MTHADPVCGMPVEGDAHALPWRDGTLFFCSASCRARFLRRPEAYVSQTSSVATPHEGPRSERRVAYFSMEVAIDPALPTYSGGLGVLAGDTLRTFADLGLPVVGVSLAHRDGYFRQRLDADGRQREEPSPWSPESRLPEMEGRATIDLEGRSVSVRAFRYDVVGAEGHVVPLLLLDTDVPENDPRDRRLTHALYGGDQRYRLAQEVVLGVGGMRVLRALGYDGVRTIHLNEGHAAFAALEQLRRSERTGDFDFAAVREGCVFTTHTPVPAGHDRFEHGLVREVVGDGFLPSEILKMLGGDDALNLTRVALDLSHYVNGVARRHREVSEKMFPGYAIHQVTNGVHSTTWTCEPFRALFDRHVPGWRADPGMLRHALCIPGGEVVAAHGSAKARLLDVIARRAGRHLAADRLTLGFARRMTAYKRPELLFHDVERLRAIGRGKLQIVLAGKAHPRDEEGKEAIRRVFAHARALGDDVPVVFLEDYDLDLAAALVAGVDVWVNTPQRPLEASGTSGMKAAHNGVPSLSVLDGWWIEGAFEGLTGWSIGPSTVDDDIARTTQIDAEDLYVKLARDVLPAFASERWSDVMRHAIALNASYFNAHRMVQQYAVHAYEQ